MQRLRFSWWGVVMVASPCLVFLALLVSRQQLIERLQFPVGLQPNGRALRGACQNQLQQLNNALMMYRQDNNGYFPARSMPAPVRLKPARTTIYWAEVVQPYFKAPMTCPALGGPPAIQPQQRRYTDYWFNANLSGKASSSLLWPAQTLVLGEGNDGTDNTNAAYALNAFPANWLSDSSSPMFRHMGAANYLFADGSVHWLKPSEVTIFGNRKNAFAIK